MRMMHEAKCFKENCFVTLTYDDDHLPYGSSLVPKDLQEFLKRLRFDIRPRRIRFGGCGEYGEEFSRPHYHVAIFNYAFREDRKVFHRAQGGGAKDVYRSAQLERLWTFGHSSVSDLTPKSARYICGYVYKKVVGDRAEEHYSFVDASTGEVHQRYPEFWRASNRPGLGGTWVRKFARSDVWPHDRVVYNGREVRPPRYYDKLLEREDPDRFEEVQQARILRVSLQRADNTPERLMAKETVARAALALQKRNKLK